MRSLARTLAVVFTTAGFCPMAAAQGIDAPWPGQTLFHPFFGSTTYLIDEGGDVVHSWAGTANPAAAVYLLDDETLLRSKHTSGSPITAEAFERVDWDGDVIWDFPFVGSDFTAHHDFEPMPNGNILVVAWDIKTSAEAIAAGRNPALLSASVFMPDKIFEVRPIPPNGFEIVWEWNLWDHLVQDFDSNASNFGVVADHPELVDINYPATVLQSSGDWNHFNAVDYNPALDQILLSAFFQREIWVIDHSTTTAEAAGRTGGNCGKGGDILYRWGNPAAYDAGTVSDQTLFATHNVQWIPPGLPGAGNILVFNNGFDRPQGEYSTADEIVPEMTATGCYPLAPGAAYGPAAALWSYSTPVPADLYSVFMGGVERLPNGNTLIIDSDDGFMREVTASKDIVWEYASPFPGGGTDPRTFRATRHQVCQLTNTFCVSAANSVGNGARMHFGGSTRVASNDLVLRADGAPPGQPGLFFYGTDPIQTPFGDGFLCVEGSTTRLLPSGNIDGNGVIAYALDVTGPPSTGGEAAAGKSWNFQLWYRDPAAGGAGFNLSDGLSVTFCP